MKWTNVKKRFPNEDGEYFTDILITNGKCVIQCNEHGWDKEEYYFHDGTGKVDGITHWMPLPEPPKE